MAFPKSLTQRFFKILRIANPALTNCRISSSSTSVKASTFSNQKTPRKYAHDPGDDGVFRRYFHRIAASAVPAKPRFFPDGENILEKLRGMDIAKERIRLDELRPPEGQVTLADAKRLLLLSQMERVKSRLRRVEKPCVSYSEFLQICVQESSGADQGLEFAKLLDESGAVIVLGNTVLLNPEQVMNAIRDLIPLTSAHRPSNLKRKELQEMEKEKEVIDKKAEHEVRRELCGGLGCLFVQTAVFMRLTFWELTWDVMEPICFYLTSVYFIGCYAFFLRTSKEPSFEGFFQSRFKSKQRRLMKFQNFDVERYGKLKKACQSDSLEQSHRSLQSSMID